jgi:hypothetical protein
LRRGCPIRTFLDQNLLAVPQDFSQRATSFIASWCQGIHRMPFVRSILRSAIFCSARAQHPITNPTNIPQPRFVRRLTAYPPCTGTIHQKHFAPSLYFVSPPARNGGFKKPLMDTSKKRYHAGKLSMRHPRSSQPQRAHHHTSEHSNISTIIDLAFYRRL